MQLRRRLPAWRAAGASPQVLEWIREGARCEWNSGPPPPFNNGVSLQGPGALTKQQSDFLEAEVARCFATGAWEAAPLHERSHISRARRLVSAWRGGPRLHRCDVSRHARRPPILWVATTAVTPLDWQSVRPLPLPYGCVRLRRGMFLFSASCCSPRLSFCLLCDGHSASPTRPSHPEIFVWFAIGPELVRFCGLKDRSPGVSASVLCCV